MPTKHRSSLFALAAALLAASIAFAQAPARPGAGTPSPAPTQPAAPPAADPDQQFTTTTKVLPPAKVAPSHWKPGQPIKDADDLLSALEHADITFRSLQADLRKVKMFGELEGGGDLVYDGKVMFISEQPDARAGADAKPRRMFQVDFLTSTADGVKRPDNRTFVFDGQWFVERQPDVRQIHKRQIVPPGQTVDPLAIGEGPFPIPIGQKRERILERFAATLLAPDDFPDAKKYNIDALKDTYQLMLVPRPGSDEAQRYREVRIWYRKSDLLPRIARTVDRDDSINVITLMNIRLNQPLPSDAFDTSVPKGWDAQIDEYRQPAPTPPSAPENAIPAVPKASPEPGAGSKPTAAPPKNR
ncbi:MAG TPA: hypothetical protein VHC70_00845 [Phycisphaerales bacterium]|jgi:hypothetical protein|nr:hypothetical protein [Phycisphaerales bacterium]